MGIVNLAKHQLKTSFERKQSNLVIFAAVFILTNSVSETIFHSKLYSVRKNRHFEKYGCHLEKIEINYDQQSVCKAYT